MQGAARDAEVFRPLALTGETCIALLELIQLLGNLFSRPLLSVARASFGHSGTSPGTGKVFYPILSRLSALSLVLSHSAGAVF